MKNIEKRTELEHTLKTEHHHEHGLECCCEHHHEDLKHIEENPTSTEKGSPCTVWTPW